MSGVYASDFGLWNTNTGKIVRHRMNLAISEISLLTRYSAASGTILYNSFKCAVVGTTFKKDGKFENFVDQSRVVEFMEKVNRIR